MDLGEWHPRQPSVRGDLLDPAAQAAALQTGYPLLLRTCDGREPLCRYRLLFVFRRSQLWRLGGGDPGLRTALDMAGWAGGNGSDFLLCFPSGIGRQAEAISRQG